MLETEVLKIEGDIHVVALKGRLTLGSRLSLLEAEINTLADNGARKIILDLENIEYADSSALGVLLHASGAVRAKGGKLLLAAPNERSAGPLQTDQHDPAADQLSEPGCLYFAFAVVCAPHHRDRLQC